MNAHKTNGISTTTTMPLRLLPTLVGIITLCLGSSALGGWDQTYKLTADDAELGDEFGRSVAVNGNLAIVGVFGDDDDGTNSGSAYLFDVVSGELLSKLTASDATIYDAFGWSVGISGDIAIVGAPHYDYYEDYP
ncbi:MAG: FG-GAP repeat protein, partial [Alphaproteobacteria bacterium]